MRRLACCGRALCLLDNVLHVLRIHWRSVCDRHDRIITGE